MNDTFGKRVSLPASLQPKSSENNAIWRQQILHQASEQRSSSAYLQSKRVFISLRNESLTSIPKPNRRLIPIQDSASLNSQLINFNRLKANLVKVKGKEDRILKELRVLRQKQEVASELLAKFPKLATKLTTVKIRTMSLSDILRLQAKIEIRTHYSSKVVFLQKWWRRILARQKITFKYFILRWKCATKIQKWFRQLVE
jgi:hypothetical protein